MQLIFDRVVTKKTPGEFRTANDAVLPFPLRQALDRVDDQLDRLIYDAFPLPKAG